MPVLVNHGIWDASNEEVPLSNPKRKDLTRNAWLKAISMLVAMKTEDDLRQGTVMFITERFSVACSTIH